MATKAGVALQDRIKKAAAQAAPSMVPMPADQIPAPPDKPQEVIPQLSDLIADRKQRLEAARLADKLGQISQQVSALNKEKKPINTKLKKILGTFKVGKAFAGEWRVNYYGTPRETLDKDLLIIALTNWGHDADEITAILKASKKYGTSYTLRVTPGDQPEEEEEEKDAA